MNPNEADRWKSEVRDEIFSALVADTATKRCLIFKGAVVLDAYLGGGRRSLDLDSNLIADFVEEVPDREVQRQYLGQHIDRAIRRHFEGQDPVVFNLTH